MGRYNNFFYFLYHSFTVFFVLIRTIISYLWVIYYYRILESPYSKKKLIKKNIKNAKRFKKVATKLRGGLIKFAQFLTTQKEIVPEEVIKVLEDLQDKVDPVPISQIEETIEEELGDSPDKIFKHFEKKALASASFGQVHKAILKTGEEVVIKVQHQYIEKTLTIDMTLMKYFITFLAYLLNRKHIIDVYKEIKEALFKELDYIQEGNFAKSFYKNFQNREDIVIPKIYSKYTTKKVIVMDFIDGEKINNVEKMVKQGFNPQDFLEIIMDSYFQQFYHDGLFHSDPHPGNLFYLAGPKVAFIDFGQSKQLDDKTKYGLKQAVVGILTSDFDEIADSFLELGLIFKKDRERMLKLLKNILSRVESGSAEEVLKLTLDFDYVKNHILSIIKEMEIIIPDGLALYGRTLAYLNGLITTLAPKANIFDMARRSMWRSY